MNQSVFTSLAVALSIGMVSLTVARAEDIYAGPVRAEIVRIIDGDTIVVEARPWPGQIVETSVRIRGVDTPELRSSCEAERQAASIAKDYVVSLLREGETVQLRQIAGDKYFGRVVADVGLPDDRDLSSLLLEGGFAVSYDGGRKQAFVCPSS
ncbi:thermonuclease family protein [Martelella radicis]|uniref:Endonuclease YncB(Thermonuclease family) n=1 Tax=Martelella radicis TaxID=1397476 RepID=A0A7W6PBL4_9HYPH|nr:thermonuclease family protein [Martelella radicis]MBB4122532.1 endonuclease YncB(thermonuclease family) [Martelella radicis]